MSAIVEHRAATSFGGYKGAANVQRRSKLGLAVAAALYGAAAVQGVPTMAAAAGAASDALEEITVTARKRSENLQDVPQSIDVFTARDLENLQIARFEDYAMKSPSISFISTGPATQMFFMRGVSDGSNPNVVNTSSTGFLRRRYVDEFLRHHSRPAPI